MLRRSIWELSSRRPGGRIPTRITTQIPSYLSFRKDLSVASQQNAPKGSGSRGKPSTPGSSILSKFFIGGLVVGAAGVTAYQTGYLDKFLDKEQHSAESAKISTVNKDMQELPKNNQDLQDDELVGKIGVPNFQDSNISNPNMDHVKNTEPPRLEDSSGSEGKNESQGKAGELIPQNSSTPIEEKKLASSSQSNLITDNESANSRTTPEENLNAKPTLQQQEAVDMTPIFTQDNAVPKEDETKSNPSQDFNTTDISEDSQGKHMRQPSSLLDDYHLRDRTEDSTAASSYGHKDLVGEVESEGAYIAKDGSLVLDFIQAIHAAEKRQAELDARIHSEEKRMLKEKYEKELKDARARELMYAEKEAILDKELNKEKVKAAAALKSLQEELEEKHKLELEQKEAEAELELKKTQELAKAELAAAIASEKASQIEKMAEANLNINALCMAFYARSEEARQSHSIHKLALGAMALEDALSKGLPIQKEIDALHTYLEGLVKDSILDLVLSSLPEETRSSGTNTLLQLNHKARKLGRTLRHFVLIPPGGGGILTHSLAHVASLLKVREADQSGDGIESLINRVESFLAEGKLLEAANTLEDGLKGSQAAEIVGDWVKQARNRAITEQALTLIQSYATSISLT
ncbi:hypothetical protein LguiA_003242 [Lonicera macranthoides]